MTAEHIRKEFLDFFKKKKHEIVVSASLIPADPTALFTSAGMQQFIPYLSGDVEPPYQRACSVQKCFRTSDIDEVGDEFHHTYFEMLGNWSFGDYFKKEAIAWSLELLIDVYNLPKDRLWVTVFIGEKGIAKDKEAIEIWQKNGLIKERIKEFGMKANFWGPVGSTGPCGPCSEIHYDQGKKFQKKDCTINNCGPNCGCGRFVEIWNLVFMQYDKTGENQYEKLPANNVDTGAGLERLTSIIQGKTSNYETDLFLTLIEKIKSLSDAKEAEKNIKTVRIIADHIRGACFLIADGVLTAKEDRGYVLRRIIRRAMRYARILNASPELLVSLAGTVVDHYKNIYPELDQQRNDILTVIQKEEERFRKTLNEGLKKFKKLVRLTIDKKDKELDSKMVFQLYDTYGFPLELTKEMAEEENLKVDEQAFEKEFARHREISRAGVKKKFGGVGEWKEKVAAQHSATHLMHQALREVLGEHVQQAGSDLTPERLRFDFTHPDKLTEQEVKKVETIVNRQIKNELSVTVKEMPYEEAIAAGALAFFKEKYPKVVKMYSMGDYSREVCAGPHVKNTREIINFKIIKEQASGAGVRRIKAVVGK